MSREHRRAAVVSLGDELTLGQSLDTNGKWLAERLVERGIVPVEHVTVPDDLAATVATLRRLSSSVDVIVCTGGLGPTADDLTRQALAEATGDTLVEDPESLAQIRAWYASRGRVMPEINAVQALRPARASAIPNPHGTAPGIHARIASRGVDGPERETDCFCMPGPPREMFPMFADWVAPRLRPASDRTVRTRVLHTFGLGESEIAQRLGDLMRRDANPLVGTTASEGVISVRIRYEGPLAVEAADATLDETERRVRGVVGDLVFASGTRTLGEAVLDALRDRRETLVVAESCTGGLLGAMLTDVAGSSDVFLGGWITYANAMKSREVGVAASIIESRGAVSGECAEAMARGALANSDAGHALAVTGIAGPGGGSAEKPVGTVWIARASRGEAATDTRLFRMTGSRESIRSWSARSALAMLWYALAGRPGTRLLRQV